MKFKTTKGRNLIKLCLTFYGIKRKLFESDKKLRQRTLLQKKQITDMKMNFTTNNIMPLINMGMTMNTNTGGCITLW